MEEISVPEGSVYVKENTTNTPTSVEYKIPCTSGDTTHNSTTNIIKDKPTRVRFEKRDSKYNYLINDETTTFEVYKCKKNEKCHPGNYTTKEEREKNGMTLVKFSKRAVIAGDEKKMKEAQKPFIKRIVYAVIAFLVPFIVSIVMGYVGNTEWKNCWTAAKDVEVSNGTIANDPVMQ